MKTFKEWTGEKITDYLQIGDVVDNEMYNHFLNILPPITNTSYILQVGGMIDVEKDENGIDKPTYITFTKDKESEGWIYQGECFPNEIKNRNPELEIAKDEMEIDEPEIDICD